MPLSRWPHALFTPKQPSYKLRINITGVTSAGVLNAAQAFLRSGLLNGAVPSAAQAVPAHGDAFTPAPANEIYRGAFQCLAPREELRKPLLRRSSSRRPCLSLPMAARRWNFPSRSPVFLNRICCR